MANKHYSNFIRSSSTSSSVPNINSIYTTLLSGEEARQFYIEEVRDVKDPAPTTIDDHATVQHKTTSLEKIQTSDKYLFLSAQNNEIDNLRRILDSCPDKINVVDDYGWSLLMIACQANSVEIVKELLKRDIDTSIRDKAGNSAQSLVIKSKNIILVNILLEHKYSKSTLHHIQHKENHKAHLKKEYVCRTCNNKTFESQEHLSSTIHNINASKGRKIPTNFVISESNRGYQIMLKTGWDRESGLGPDGSGNKYPIRTVQKKDRKGLGHGKKREGSSKVEIVGQLNKKRLKSDYVNNRQMEISFRREFY